MIGTASLIAGAIGLGSSILGGLSAYRHNEKAYDATMKNLRQQRSENQNWYDRRYNEDSTQRADAQRVLRMTADAIRQRNRAAAGTAAVMGGTEESVAATKEANAKAMADAASRIAVAGEARKDDIEQSYRAANTSINNSMANAESAYEQGKANAVTQAMQGVASAAGAAGAAFDEYQLERQNRNS